MSLELQIIFWAITLAVLCYGLHLFGSAVAPFAAGIALGNLLDPVVSRMEALEFNRPGVSLVILVAFAATFEISFITVAPNLGTQLVAFARRLSISAMKLQVLVVDVGSALIQKYGGGWLSALGFGESISSSQIQKSLGDFVAEGAQWLIDGLRTLAPGWGALFGLFSLLVITPVAAFYILIDWHRMIAEIDSWLPLDHRDQLRAIAKEINHALAGFIRGQSLACLFLALGYGLGLTLLGLDFGFLIGVLAGVLSFVPYVGSLTDPVLSLGAALVQGWPSLKLFLTSLAIVGCGQFLEGYVVSPKLVGESIGFHTVWLMFALLAFGELFVSVGLIIAVSTAAAIGVIVRHFIAIYITSSVYRGRSTAMRR